MSRVDLPPSVRSRFGRIARSASVAAAGAAAVAVVASATAATPGPSTRASLAETERSLGAQIAAQSEAIDAVEARIVVAGAALSRMEARLAASRRRLERLDAELDRQVRELRRLSGELATSRDRLAGRVVDLYQQGSAPNTLEIVLGAASLDAAVDALELRQRVLEQDESIVAEVRAGQVAVRAARDRTRMLRREQRERVASLQEQTAERRTVYAGLVARRDRLSELQAARRAALARVQVEQRALRAEARALAAAAPQVASASQAAAATAPPTASQTSAGVGFIWPVHGALVSPFGMRGGRMHTGIDISAGAGTPIAASASGTVAFAGSMSGYGLIVVIQHAGGIATAYAHNSRNDVRVGQAVSQGQTIGAVGCTGHCSGDHVHFEVRVNGAAVDPMAYL